MSHYHHQRHLQVLRCVFHAAQDRLVGYRARCANNKQISQSLVENQLRRYPGVGTSKYGGERMLVPGHFRPPSPAAPAQIDLSGSICHIAAT